MLKFASSLILCSATAVLADLLFQGPYGIDLESIEECEEPEYKGGVILDIHLEQINDNVVYQGNITFNFDMDDPEILTKCVCYTWGSTGGWYYTYTQDVYDLMEFGSTKFPETFNNTYSAMGVYGKHMKAGTYPFRNYTMKDHQLENFDVLPYGRFRLVTYFSKDDKPLGCMEFRVEIKEKAS